MSLCYYELALKRIYCKWSRDMIYYAWSVNSVRRFSLSKDDSTLSINFESTLRFMSSVIYCIKAVSLVSLFSFRLIGAKE